MAVRTFVHDGIDTSGFVNVSPEYMTHTAGVEGMPDAGLQQLNDNQAETVDDAIVDATETGTLDSQHNPAPSPFSS